MDRLTREEDAELRRLAALAAYGELGPDAAELYDDLRARDRRLEIREPEDVVVPHLRPKTEARPATGRHDVGRPVDDGPVTMAG